MFFLNFLYVSLLSYDSLITIESVSNEEGNIMDNEFYIFVLSKILTVYNSLKGLFLTIKILPFGCRNLLVQVLSLPSKN